MGVMTLSAKNTKWAVASLVLAGIAVVFAAGLLSGAKPSSAAPYLGCSPNGYIVKDNGGHTDIQAIDMVTGQGSAGPQVQNHTLNAIGYNPKDNHFYAWDLQNGVYVKMDANFTVTATFTAAQIGYTGPQTNNIFAGDVDEDGFHWFFRVAAGTTSWYKVDTNQATPTEVDAGSGPNPTDAPDTLTEGTDWAYVPGTDSFYRGMDNGTNITIVAFNRTTEVYSVIGKVTNITGSTADLNMGAVYADPDGNFYMSSNGSGVLWRVDLDDPSGPGPTYTAVQLDAGDVGSNDGARCVLASVPTDYGDAPSGYDTLIADDGPRHNVGNFNVFETNAPLMLGKKVDLESDGFPNADATGDDADHQGISGTPFVDDERGVSHIVATPGSSSSISVPVYVTNTSAQNAAQLVGWIDLDNDGTFEAAERVSDTLPVGFIGYRQLTFPAPPAPYATNTFSRFRLFSAADTSTAATAMLPTGPAADGEVEDVLVQVGTYDLSKTANPAEGSIVDSGQTVTYTLDIKNTGSTALTNLKVDDDLTDVLDDATIEGTPTVSPASAGTATVNGSTLEFLGDIGIGQTVVVTYTVKIKDSASLGNTALNNVVLATHSTSCHPDINNGAATVSDPNCKTSHTVNGLANTGSNIVLPILLAAGFIGTAVAIVYPNRKRLGWNNSQNSSQK